MSAVLPRVTPRAELPRGLAAIRLPAADRSRAHMIASLLLDYPDDAWFARVPVIRGELATLPPAVAEPLAGFLDDAELAGSTEWQRRYVSTFDVKRKCSLYLSYFATGDTRKRGTALVTFLEAYRAAGWEFAADELPDYLPVVLEFSALSDSPIAGALIASHREGIEVLRAALESMGSAWAPVVRAVTLTLPPIDERTRQRYLDLVTEGPPTETVGLSFLGHLPPFVPAAQRGEGS